MGWGEDTEIRNASIRDTMLGIEDHGIFTAMLYLDYGGTSQGFGGYSFSGSKIPAEGDYAGYFIRRVLQVVGVSKWEDLTGEKIRVKSSHSKVEAIGHFLEDRWYNPQQEFKEKFPESQS